MNELIDQLLELKEEIKDGLEKKAKLEGQLELHQKSLEALGYSTVAEAEADIKKLEVALEKRKKEVEKEIKELLEKYGM